MNVVDMAAQSDDVKVLRTERAGEFRSGIIFPVRFFESEVQICIKRAENQSEIFRQHSDSTHRPKIESYSTAPQNNELEEEIGESETERNTDQIASGEPIDGAWMRNGRSRDLLPSDSSEDF